METTHTPKVTASVGEVASSEVEVPEKVTADLAEMASLLDSVGKTPMGVGRPRGGGGEAETEGPGRCPEQ